LHRGAVTRPSSGWTGFKETADTLLRPLLDVGVWVAPPADSNPHLVWCRVCQPDLAEHDDWRAITTRWAWLVPWQILVHGSARPGQHPRPIQLVQAGPGADLVISAASSGLRR
jgi:hypothetical protein